MKNKQLQSLTRRALGTVAVASLCLAPAFSQAETEDLVTPRAKPSCSWVIPAAVRAARSLSPKLFM